MKKRIIRQIMTFMLTVVSVASIGMTAHAYEEETATTKEEMYEKYKADTGYEEGDAVFNEYLEIACERVENEKYQYMWKESAPEVFDALCYVETCGGTEEEWYSKGQFEQMLLRELYVEIVVCTTYSNYDRYFGSWQNYNWYTIANRRDAIKFFSEEQAEAYVKIMKWQYNYIVENNAVYNFMTGVDSLGNRPGDKMIEEPVPEVVQTVQEETEVETTEVLEETSQEVEESEQEIEEEEETEEEGIWDELIESLKEKWFTFTILGVLVVALIVVVVYRKSKGIDDDKLV